MYVVGNIFMFVDILIGLLVNCWFGMLFEYFELLVVLCYIECFVMCEGFK